MFEIYAAGTLAAMQSTGIAVMNRPSGRSDERSIDAIRFIRTHRRCKPSRAASPEIDVGRLGGARHAQRSFSHETSAHGADAERVDGEEPYRPRHLETCTATVDLMPTALEIA